MAVQSRNGSSANKNKKKNTSPSSGRAAAGRKKSSGKPVAKSRLSPQGRQVQKQATPARNGAGRSTKGKFNQPNTQPRRQTVSVLIFCMAIFLFCLVSIPGRSIWDATQSVILGIFGICAFIWPLILVAICFFIANGRIGNYKGKIILSCILVILLSTAIYIFIETDAPEDIIFTNCVSRLYAQGIQRIGSGAIGGILGVPLIKLMGSVPARVTICVLGFACLMILTGTTLFQIFSPVIAPVKAIRKTREREARKRAQDIPVYPPKTQRVYPDSKEKNTPILNTAVSNHADSNDEYAGERKEARWAKFRNIVLGEEMHSEPGKALTESYVLSENENAVEKGKQPASDVAELVHQATNTDNEDEKIEKKDKTAVSAEDEARNADYRYPPISLLDEPQGINESDATIELQTNAERLVSTLESFGVQTRVVNISRGPVVTRYELQPLAGVKISKITNLSDDLALNLAASGVRIEAPIPGKQAVGIEVPNKIVGMVKMRELVDSNAFVVAKSKLTVALGKDIAGAVCLADLAKMPHLLIAGATGSGKSVCINSLICSLLYKSSPNDVRMLMIDPKFVELSVYNGIPHLLVPVVNDPRKAAGALNWAVNEMLHRYGIFKDNDVRDLISYNKLVQHKKAEDPECDMEKLPQIVIIVDELADLMMAAPKEVEDAICRLAQMARAAGMHLVIATQRPSVDVITGLIKANIPSRIAFFVSSQVDSRTILDSSGAEKLLGRGDMLFSPVGALKPMRIQGCFLSDKEIAAVTDYVKKSSSANYDDEVSEEIVRQAVTEPGKKNDDSQDEDPAMMDAIRVVVEAGQASTSLLQRRLSVGYARAGRIIDRLEEKGIIGPHEGSKPRKVLVSHQQWLEMNMSAEQLINESDDTTE